MSSPARKGLILFFVAALLTGAGLYLWRTGRPAISEREYATALLGQFLGEKFHPKTVLIIGNPFSKLSGRPAQVYDFQNAGVAGLKSGLGRSAAVMADFPALKPSVLENPASIQVDPSSSTPLSFLVESAAFDALVKSHAPCDLVISLIGLPINLSGMEAWTRPGPPHFALFLPDWRMVGDGAGIQDAFSSGKLVGAVVARPSSGNTTDFRERYVLVHSNNVAALLKNSPDLFGP